MSVEETTPQEPVSTEPAPPNAPEDFTGYVKWRKTGELPAEAEPTEPVAAAPVEEQAPPAETEPESGPEEPQQNAEEPQDAGAANRPGSRQRRYDRVLRENEQLKARMAEIEQRLSQPPQQPQQQQLVPEDEPKLVNFDTVEEFNRTYLRWLHQGEMKKQEQAAAAKASMEREQKARADFDSRQAAARKAHPDYDDVIASMPAPEGPGVQDALRAIYEDDAGPELLYYLCRHPDEVKRIAAMTPHAAVREVGRISVLVNPPSVANGKPKFSAAPKPPPPPARYTKAGSDSINDPAVQADFRRYVRARLAMKDK